VARGSHSAHASLARLIGRYADGVRHAADRAARNLGPDNVHDLRVATRRLRAVLKAFHAELDQSGLEELNFDLASLTRETGPLRDADVRRRLLMPLISHSMDLAPDARRNCAIALEEARTDARRELRLRVRDVPWQERMARIRAGARDGRLVKPLSRPLAQLVGQFLYGQLRDLRRRMGRRRLDPRRLHRLRVRIRNTRYAVEAMLPLVRLPRDPLAKSLRRLQDLLGVAHDLTEAQRFLAIDPLPGNIGATLADFLDASAAARLRDCRRRLHALAIEPPAEWQRWLARKTQKGNLG